VPSECLPFSAVLPQDRKWRVTGLGWVVLGLMAGCVLLAVFARGGLQVFGVAVAGIILLLALSEGMSGEGDVIGSTGRKRETLRDRHGRSGDR
jgi:hypothetical protein